MARTNPETLFKVKVVERFKTLDDIWYFKTQQLALLGIPDFIICYRGRFIAWELKRDERAPTTKLQKWVLKQIAWAGGLSAVVHPENLEEEFAKIVEIGRLYR